MSAAVHFVIHSILPHRTPLGAKAGLGGGVTWQGCLEYLAEQISGLRHGEEETLRVPATELLQALQLALGLDPFSDGVELQGLRETDDRPGQCRLLCVAVDAGDERPIDLQDV